MYNYCILQKGRNQPFFQGSNIFFLKAKRELKKKCAYPFFNVCVCMCVSVGACHYVSSAHMGQKKASDPPDLEL